MAEKRKSMAKDSVVEESELSTEKPTAVETTAVARYRISELVAECSMFGVSPDIARASLHRIGRESYTKAEAKKIMADFKSKEVK